ncbi:S8 family serine peptidase [Dokdonella sp.]|uniref:S8 family serine peptidase n=1 Tax=Dokdonella sp. TaxID=2291710 RepID=UPI0027B8817E|nr:S8 family serine peptidase [Dokdonella sp.]
MPARAGVTALLLALFACGAAQAGARQWLRVETDAATLRQVLGAPAPASDYGRFQWLEVDDDQLARLRARAGLRLDVVEAPFELDLGGQHFDPLAGVPDFGAWPTTTAAAGQADFRLVQFKGPVRESDLRALRQAGLEPVQYLHPFAYVVWGRGSDLQTLQRSAAVRWSGEFLPAWRLLPQWRLLAAGEREVHVLVYRHATGVMAALAAVAPISAPAQPIDRMLAVVSLKLRTDRLAELAVLPGVYSVQPVPLDGGLRGEMSNQVNAGNIDAGNIAFPGYLDYLDDIGVHGNGVILADVDGGIYDTHPDLVNRMLPCLGSTCGGSAVDSHGTHTAATMAGDGSSGVKAGAFLRGLGMAPQAKLIEQVYDPTFTQPGGMLKLMTESQRNGAYASGNSWGPAGSPLGYDGDTRQVDVGVRDADPTAAGDQPLVYVLSIMNGYGGSVSSLGTPDEAKNLFAIGSTRMQSSATVQSTQIDDISSNSAHGPAQDGRSVPAMVAPGCSEDSAASATGYGLMCGTSMASPHVTGAAALFAEYYRGLTAGSDPSPALVKAAFAAVAKSLIGHLDADGVVMTHLFDNRQGWGRMQVTPVLAPAQHVEYLDQSVVFDNTGDSWSHTYTADDPSQPIRIMLAWTDAPGHGLGGTTPAWNNNLDLRVTANGQTYLGNDLDGSGWSKTGGSADGRNNMEAVFLQSAQHGGQVSVEVLASDINSDALPNSGDGTDQDFALVCYNCRAATPALSDLAVSASATDDHATPGQRLTFAAEITNVGLADASDVHITLIAPGLDDAIVTTGADWDCGLTVALLSCTHAGVLAAGASVVFPVDARVKPSAADPLLATFKVSTPSAEVGLANNTVVLSLPLLDRIFGDGFDAAGAP